MPEQPALVLHLGAHKTATSHLQARLAAGAGALAAAGVGYEPLGPLRRDFTGPFLKLAGGRAGAPDPAALQARLRGYLDRMGVSSGGRFILSDENLAGNCTSIMRTGRIYPDLARRLALLSSLLPQRPIRVVMTLRAYPGFLASAYGEMLRHAPHRPFAECHARLDLSDGGWLRVAEELVAAFGAEALRLMRFEEIPARLPALVEALAGAPLALPETDVRREGLSAAAIAAIAAGMGAAEAEARHPRGPGSPGFDPWQPGDRAALEALHQDHLAEIARRWPGVFL